MDAGRIYRPRRYPGRRYRGRATAGLHRDRNLELRREPPGSGRRRGRRSPRPVDLAAAAGLARRGEGGRPDRYRLCQRRRYPFARGRGAGCGRARDRPGGLLRVHALSWRRPWCQPALPARARPHAGGGRRGHARDTSQSSILVRLSLSGHGPGPARSRTRGAPAGRAGAAPITNRPTSALAPPRAAAISMMRRKL